MTQQKLELTWYNKDQALIPAERGRYGYEWVEPTDPRYCQTHYLVMGETITGEQSDKQDGTQYSERADIAPTTDNLLIIGESGDVLEALTRVPELAEKYVGKVKCVYIDPPFNTAQTFANYEDNLEHSIWLTMMRDRLLHLKKLLADDGSIWVHLDDVENHRMRLLMDEVFGAGNFLAELGWQKSDTLRNDAGLFSVDFDYILGYRKSDSWTPNRMPRPAEWDEKYSSRDGDPMPWFNAGPTAPGAATHQGMVYAIQNPVTGEFHYPLKGRHWALSQEEVLRSVSEYANYELVDISDEKRRAELCGIAVEDVRAEVSAVVLKDPLPAARKTAEERFHRGNWPLFHFGGKVASGYPAKKTYPPTGGVAPRTWLPFSEVGSSRSAKAEIKTLFPNESPFATPKPERLLERIIHIATNPGDIVLDCFAGSGTTAAVAHKMGRRWVTCELLEDTFNRFAVPRLTKVVRGEDTGGITTTKGARVDGTIDGLPEGMSADDAQKFTSLLNKVIKDNPELKNCADVKALKEATKTRNSGDAVTWRGGGSFTIATLSQPCFDFAPELGYPTLTEHATGENLERSIAAELRFALTESPYFVGQRNREMLAVIEGELDRAKVDDLMANLPDGHSILFTATILDEGVRDYVRSFKNGSAVKHIPFDIFPTTARQEN